MTGVYFIAPSQDAARAIVGVLAAADDVFYVSSPPAPDVVVAFSASFHVDDVRGFLSARGYTPLPSINNPAVIPSGVATSLAYAGVTSTDTMYAALVKLLAYHGHHWLDPNA